MISPFFVFTEPQPFTGTLAIPFWLLRFRHLYEVRDLHISVVQRTNRVLAAAMVRGLQRALAFDMELSGGSYPSTY